MNNQEELDVNELTQLTPFDATVHKNHGKFSSGNLFVKTQVLESEKPLQPWNKKMAEVISETQRVSNA